MYNFYAAPSFACQRDHNYKTNFDISRINFFFFFASQGSKINIIFFFLSITINQSNSDFPHPSYSRPTSCQRETLGPPLALLSLTRQQKQAPPPKYISFFNLFLLHHESPTLSLIMFHSVFHLMY